MHELNGKILGCWCKPKQCHGDTLVAYFKNYYLKNENQNQNNHPNNNEIIENNNNNNITHTTTTAMNTQSLQKTNNISNNSNQPIVQPKQRYRLKTQTNKITTYASAHSSTNIPQKTQQQQQPSFVTNNSHTSALTQGSQQQMQPSNSSRDATLRRWVKKPNA